MSTRAITNISRGARTFSTCSVRFQEHGRPLISESLKQKLQAKRVQIPASLAADNIRMSEFERLRVVPALKTYFGGNPVHDENLNELNLLIRKYINLPTKVLTDEELRGFRFISIEAYKKSIDSGTRLKSIHFKELTSALHRLRSIDPELLPRDVSEVLDKYTNKTSDITRAAIKLKTLDEFGRAFGKAKRKASKAEVYVVRGTGQSMINGKTLIEYLPRDTDRGKIAYPFQVISQEGQFNVFANVSGGGFSGQAEAVMYAIAKALVVVNPLLKPRLYKAGLMTSDARVVERKKPGKVKARKSPTWVKR